MKKINVISCQNCKKRRTCKEHSLCDQFKIDKIPLEKWEQEQVFNWANNNQIKWPELKHIQGSMNGANIPKGHRIQLKKQGLKSGWPDIEFPFDNNYFTGLHIELKRRKGGTVSKDQKETIKFLLKQKRYCLVCYGYHEAIAVIKAYLLKDVITLCEMKEKNIVSKW